jgi:hypothetical protein
MKNSGRKIKIYIVILLIIFMVLSISWISSALRVPEISICYHQTLKGTDITITSPIYFSTRQKVRFSIRDTVTVFVMLPKYPIHEVLPFKGIIEDVERQGDVTQYKTRVIGSLLLGYPIDEAVSSDSTRTMFKLIQVKGP